MTAPSIGVTGRSARHVARSPGGCTPGTPTPYSRPPNSPPANVAQESGHRAVAESVAGALPEEQYRRTRIICLDLDHCPRGRGEAVGGVRSVLNAVGNST